MRRVSEQTILVTGATAGLGRGVARELADRGATVLVHGRERNKVEQAVASLPGGRASAHVADLASLAEVAQLADEVERKVQRLDVLVNNAGVGGVERSESRDGHELHLAVNHLAPFLLTLRLLPLLRRSAPARVVNVSSLAQVPVDFEDPMLERGYEPMGAYGQSKLAQVLFAFELAERLDPQEVAVTALHPATLMDTKMVRESFGGAQSSVEEGVEATVRLAVGEDVEGVSGAFFNGLEQSEPHAQAFDAEARRRLWELSERLTGAAS